MQKGAQSVLNQVVVRPILRVEHERWKELMKAHHYLGFQGLVGERVQYVATVGERWVALLGWAAAALKLSARDVWIGWNWTVQLSRLRYIANNVRFLILPGESVPNLASRILALNLKRLSRDYSDFYGHPVFLAETFVDLNRNRGTCYLAQGWEFIGETKGFGRRAKGYVTHGSKKGFLVKPLCFDAKARLSNPLRDPINREEKVMSFNYKKLPIEGKGGLMDMLRTIHDPRSKFGSQHSFVSILAIAVCAMLSGAKSYQAIADWAKKLSANERKKFFIRKENAPSESTFRKTLQKVDGSEFDGKVSAWLLKQSGFTGQIKGDIAIDGKTVRGSYSADKKAIHLLSAFLHEEKIVIAQREVGEKTNEIPELKNILKPMNIRGSNVTVDAMHTQVESATFIVREKEADYTMIVKGNQPTLEKQLEESLGNQAFSPSGVFSLFRNG
jgi:hypothetical protein